MRGKNMDVKILSAKEVEKLDDTAKKEYFDKLREYSKSLKTNDLLQKIE